MVLVLPACNLDVDSGDDDNDYSAYIDDVESLAGRKKIRTCVEQLQFF